MARTIILPNDLYAELEDIAQPFVDREPADVIRRLVGAYQATGNSGRAKPVRAMAPTANHVDLLDARAPRERGVRVEIGDQTLIASSVRDLYEQVLHLLAHNGTWDKVQRLVPYRTSSKRYLIAKEPVHPNGKRFVVPVDFRGLYMETHKSYNTAISQLEPFLAKCDLSIRVLS